MNIQLIKCKVAPLHTVKTCVGTGDVAPPIINFDTRWSELLASSPSRFTHGKTLLPIEQKATWAPDSNSVQLRVQLVYWHNSRKANYRNRTGT